jgi:glutathione synthase/RimK-type ligase-like ATP-grasp enzyme
MRTILFIADLSERYYFEPFLQACDGYSLRVLIFDQSKFPRDAAFSIFTSGEGVVTGFVDVLSINGGRVNEVRLSLSDVQVAWYIRGGSAHNSVDKLHDLESRFSENETRASLRSLFSALECKWVNKLESIEFLSSNKLYQQIVATKVGLKTPATVMGNDYISLCNFSEQQQRLLIKTIGYTHLDTHGRYFLYSQLFEHSELTASAAAIRSCPVFGQEYIKKRYEHRVMVIGKKVYSCRIDSQASERTKIDWRHYDFAKVAHVAVELPSDVQHKLLDFMQRVGLNFGAIDLIETPKNEFVFLEVNPSGQWGWIADFAGIPVARAVAEMLVSI